MKTLYLKQQVDPSQENGKQYVITKTVNVAFYSIGETLGPNRVERLCSDKNYKIIIS